MRKGCPSKRKAIPLKQRRSLRQAWQTATDDFEASIAAHYVARHQKSPAEALHWNQITDRANLASEEKVRGFYPSLYLNLGKSHEDLDHLEEARHFYKLAEAAFSVLSDDRYGNIVRDAVQRGLERLASKIHLAKEGLK